MKRKLLISGILMMAVLLIAVGPVFGKTDSGEKIRNIDLIIEKSGMQGQLATIPGMFAQQLPENFKSDAKTGKITEIIKTDFSVENFSEEIKRAFFNQYNEKYTQEVLKFYDSDLGIKMAECEITGSQPAFLEKVKDFDIDNVSGKRRRIITKLFDDMRVLDFYYMLSTATFEGMFSMFNALLPADKKISNTKLNEINKEIKDNVYSDSNKQRLLAEYYMMYESATDNELVEYNKFNLSGHGKWMNNCMKTGMVSGFKKCTEKLVNDILVYMSENQSDNEDAVQDNNEDKPLDEGQDYNEETI